MRYPEIIQLKPICPVCGYFYEKFTVGKKHCYGKVRHEVGLVIWRNAKTVE